MDKTQLMEMRKAVYPLLKDHFDKQNDALQKANAAVVDRLADVLASSLSAMAETIAKRITDAKPELLGSVRIENPVTAVTIKDPVKAVKIENIKEMTGVISTLQKSMQSQFVAYEKKVSEALEKSDAHVKYVATELSKAIMATKIEPEVYTNNKPMPVSIMDSNVMFGGGGGTKSDNDRIWLRERYTYTTVSGQQVPSKVEKWSDNLKLTENYEYDANANAVVKSRSLDPSTSVGT